MTMQASDREPNGFVRDIVLVVLKGGTKDLDPPPEVSTVGLIELCRQAGIASQ